MFGLLLTLVGSVLLAVMMAMRQQKNLVELTSTITPVVGKVHPKAEGILKETYLFRMGLIYIAVGTVLQIFGFDIPLAEVDILLRAVFTIFGFILLLYLGRKIAFFFAEKRLQSIPPFMGYSKNVPVGSLWLDDTQGSTDKHT
ncbi:MAG: hypothetical protein ACQEXQ_22300 [Bacillota bacterium]